MSPLVSSTSFPANPTIDSSANLRFLPTSSIFHCHFQKSKVFSLKLSWNLSLSNTAPKYSEVASSQSCKIKSQTLGLFLQ
ncbi:hypothetical protein AXX17_AT1G11910 [Arabidopsis thaliana]|uniref:Uncharacterized protein n=1 Tax=Arabidopsis thaliana TaxID=3702 RepID=A0A178WD44_ARATH|nr:hypothetical protein AXX17_AT1G11910 [Arabidopsis thaliana]